jgi:DNA-binding CsgD family transcriptional regulator
MPNPSKREIAEAAIATVEAAYDIRSARDAWFPGLIEAALPLLDHGLGAGGLIAVKPPTPGPPTIEAMHVAQGPEDLIAQHVASSSALPQDKTYEQTVTGVFVVSEKLAEHPEMLEVWRSFFPGAHDAIGMMTVDTDGRGILILAPTPKVVQLSKAERARWEMMSAHVASGVRLRNALTKAGAEDESRSDMPHGAEAVIDPSNFQVSDALSDARTAESLKQLREAAVRMDNARVSGRKADQTDKALAEWWALLRGRWSLVDWFDTDDRRYVLALPNPPQVPNPRGLTEQEGQVISFAALGDSHKFIAYRLGLSRSRVTHLLASGMRKLGIKTQAQLVARLHQIAVAEQRAGRVPE